MKTLREPETRALRHVTLTDNLNNLARHAARLRGLAHRATLLVTAASLEAGASGPPLAEVRRAMNGLAQALGHIHAAEGAILPRIDVRGREPLARALSPPALETFDAFLQLTRTVCALLDSKAGNLELSRAELLRFVNDDLEAAVSSLEAAIQIALRHAQQEDHTLAFLDDLTNLPNRRGLYHHADRLWDGPNSRSMVLMRLNLDRFKKVNDDYGHAAGDHVLAHVARLLRAHLRRRDFVARVGGDEFVMLIAGDPGTDALAKRARKIIAAIAQPIEFEGMALTVEASVGIVQTGLAQGQGLDRMLHNADLALYAAKAAGGGRYHLFTPDLRSRHETSETLLQEIRDGIAGGEFIPYFQPQVNGRSGILVGMEALMRWNHPRRGLLTPYHFLDAAQAGGLLCQLDDQITLATLKALKGWQDQRLDVPQVSINISAGRLVREDLLQVLLDRVLAAGVPAECVALEILESAMIEANSTQMIQTVRNLSAAGFKVELDDFGTGHASIANLRHFKVDRIKIDRSFIKDVHLHGELAKITGAMISLAHSLRIDALGEGVESVEERLVLNALGVDHIQGYGVARPMPEADVGPWILRTQSARSLPVCKTG